MDAVGDVSVSGGEIGSPAVSSTLPLEIRNEDATEDKGIDIDETAISTTTQEASGSVDPR